MRPPTINQRHMLALALETGGSTRTIRRWLRGEAVSPLAAYALAAAAAKLRIKRTTKKGKTR